MYAKMRKRVNSSQSQTDSEAEPLVTASAQSKSPPRNEHFSVNANANANSNPQNHPENDTATKTLSARLLLYIHKVRGYRKREMCKLVMVSFLAIMFLSSTAGLILAKTGVAYKRNGKTKILSPEEIASSQYKDSTPRTVSKEKSFAIVVNTFKRPDMLKSALNHWVNTCGTETSISQVFIVWAELDVEPPKPEEVLSEDTTSLRKSKSQSTTQSKPTVEFIRVPKDSLNSRFLPIQNLKTDAVFMVDDDVRIDCQSLKSSFEAWRHYPDAIVGFYPRLASPKLKHGLFQSKADTIYHTWPIVYARQKFNIILTKASFFDQKYLAMYHDEKENPKEILDYIDAHKNCEDIAMAFMVARKTGSQRPKEIRDGYCSSCPVYTKGKIKDEGLFNGISTSGGSLAPSGHMEKRSLCLDEITSIYKKHGWEYPLFDVELGEQSWRHVFWWLNMPSIAFEWFSVGNTLM